MAGNEERPRLLAGLGLPLRALVAMLRDPHERGPALLVASVLIVGTVFYTLVEGWSVVDAGIGILVSFFTALASKTRAMQAERRRHRGLG